MSSVITAWPSQAAADVFAETQCNEMTPVLNYSAYPRMLVVLFCMQMNL